MIPEQQLTIWSNPGAQASAQKTHESVRNAIQTATWSSPIKYDVFLQGSYKNGTNIRSDSDVDIVVLLKEPFLRDITRLSPQDTILYHQSHRDADYKYANFKNDVLKTLKEYYGASYIQEGDKSINVLPNSGRIAADVVVCQEYRIYEYFHSLDDYRCIEGIALFSVKNAKWIYNFPRQHYQNGVDKNSSKRTNELFKPTVRIIKNARTALIEKGMLADNIAPSYFIECFLYNCPDNHFTDDLQKTYMNIIEWVVAVFKNKTDSSLLCQNGLQTLFGNDSTQWQATKAFELTEKLIWLWKNWQ